MADSECDVLIIGAGMAGACLARQLRLELPELRVIQVEKKEVFDYWVGESTTEPWHDYVVRKLKLGPYLIKNHLRKNGFRFFWDSEAKDLTIPQMSECGQSTYAPLLTAWQLDRAAFDRDMAQMNRELGVDVRLGVRVLADRDGEEPAITLDGENGHVVRTSDGVIRCKWLVDAGGRNSPLTKKLHLIDGEETLPTASYWSRYEGCRSIDELGDEAWHRRVHFTLRYGSTQHLFYDGYWIWIIPLHSGVVSIGVTFDTRMNKTSFRDGAELTEWFRRHPGLNEILGERPEVKDFISLRHLSRSAKQQFSADRWFLTGMAGLVVDPFLSQTSVFYAISNRFITELIRADLAGDRDLVRFRLPACNGVLRNLWKSWEHRIKDDRLFHYFASYDVMAPWLSGTLLWMYTFIMPMQTSDWKPFFEQLDSLRHADPQTIEMAMKNMERASGGPYLDVFDRTNVEFCEWLEARGRLFEMNQGQFQQAGGGGTHRPNVIMRAYQNLTGSEALAWSFREGDITYRWMFADRIERMCRVEGVEWNEEVFNKAFEPNVDGMQTLKDEFAKYRSLLGQGESQTEPREQRLSP
jgi:tetracycline 7-halogenase / FADH2 O2-dependent halogenase